MTKELRRTIDKDGIISKLSYFVLNVSPKGVELYGRLGDWREVREKRFYKNILEKREYISLQGIYQRVKSISSDLGDLNSFYDKRVILSPNNNVRKLNLSDLGLKFFPSERLSELYFLEKLVFNNNEITFLPWTFNKLDSLKIFCCENNSIKNLNSVLFEMKSLEKVNFKGNPLNEDSKKLLGRLKAEKGVEFSY